MSGCNKPTLFLAVLLGFILGGLLEENLRRTVMLYDGRVFFLLERPAVVAIGATTLVVWILPLWQRVRARLEARG